MSGHGTEYDVDRWLSAPTVVDMRNAKVSLVVYVMVEMHEPNWVLRQFEWRKRIPPPPRHMKELHKVDMRRKNNKDWAEKHKEHIYA
ncbi:hypothetical protein Gotur_002135 [Gossypium turneri]